MAWRDIVPPRTDGSGGYLRADVSFRDAPGVVTLEAHTGHGGWRMAARSTKGAPDIVAGITRATVRVRDAEIELTWPKGLPDGVPVGAVVSDVPALVRFDDLRRTVAALYDYLPSLGGRPKGSPNRLRASLVAEVLAHPGITDDEIARKGVELGIWLDAPGDYDVVRKRVRRLRESAGQ